jgi:hypothetical protein
MAECERLRTCPFFTDRMENMPNVSEVMKRTYCLGDKTLCARYQLGVVGVAVPADLFPQDAARMREILRGR